MQWYSNTHILLFVPFRDIIRIFSILSMKGLMSLKVDVDYNTYLLFENSRINPEDLEKLG